MNLPHWLHHHPDPDTLRMEVIDTLRTLYDPEIPVNIFDLGLIYALEVDTTHGYVHVAKTLTAPTCPVAQTFPDQVRQALEGIDGINRAEVELVWDPPWHQDMMSEAARLQLGLL